MFLKEKVRYQIDGKIKIGHIVRIEDDGRRYRVLEGAEPPSDDEIAEWSKSFFCPGFLISPCDVRRFFEPGDRVEGDLNACLATVEDTRDVLSDDSIGQEILVKWDSKKVQALHEKEWISSNDFLKAS